MILSEADCRHLIGGVLFFSKALPSPQVGWGLSLLAHSAQT
jgi:hypothetical protein